MAYTPSPRWANRKRDAVSLGEALEAYVAAHKGMAPKLAESKLQSLWPEVVGPFLAQHTESLYLHPKSGRLTVVVSHAVVKAELQTRKAEMLARIQEFLEGTGEVVKEIFLK